MAKKGRPQKWLIRRQEASTGTPHLDRLPQQATRQDKDIVDFAAFLEKNSQITERDELMLAYAEQQLCDGCDKGVIANRIEKLRAVTIANVAATVAQTKIDHLIWSLRKEKAATGGGKRKGLFTIDELAAIVAAAADTPRDVSYQVTWWLLLASGCRPNELHTMKVDLNHGGLSVVFNGRKNDLETGCCSYLFLFDYSIMVPSWIRAHILERGLPKIGTASNVSSCINSWLKSFGARQGINTEGMTSTSGRVRMDNVLRAELDCGEISEVVYESMMGHKVTTSEKFYKR